jgi:glycerophosphoryl diester phosphodiesterase
VVAEIKHTSPSALTAILFASTYIDPVQMGRAVSADFVHPCWERFPAPHTLLTPAWMDAVRGAGFGIMCWHEERPDEIRALAALGVDGICSDTPDVLTALTTP